MSVYQQLFEKVSPVIKSYRDDLEKHDKASIEAYPSTPFLHWTRESGTQLVFLWPASDNRFPPQGHQVPYLFGTRDRYGLVHAVIEIAQCLAKPDHDPHLCHYFDGSKLHRVSLAKAVDIAKLHFNRVTAQWNKQAWNRVAA